MATINAEKLLKELAEKWESLGKQSVEKDSTGVLRACALNLLVCVEGDLDVNETVAEIMHEYPSRVIVLRVQPGAALAGQAVAQCWMPFGRRQQICCEQIEITCSPEALADVDPVIRGVWAGDLPIVFWCASAALLSDPVFTGQILPMAHKVIVDSRAAVDPDALLRRLQEIQAGGQRVGDLSWTRVTRWRETVAQLFDNPLARAQVNGLSDLTIEYTSARTPPTARYLEAWVQSSVAAPLRAQLATSLVERYWEIHRLRLRGTGMDVAIVRRDEVTVDVTWNQQRLSLAFPKLTKHGLMLEELGILGPDPVFDRVLPWIAF